MVENQCDVGFAYDGDADRCLCVDEKGNVITGDHILYIYGRYMKERGKLVNNTVVTTVMSNFGRRNNLSKTIYSRGKEGATREILMQRTEWLKALGLDRIDEIKDGRAYSDFCKAAVSRINNFNVILAVSECVKRIAIENGIDAQKVRVSYIGRNIVDCLNMIEELRNLNPPVGVIFETDHIDTLGGNDSLLLSILASLAEAESRNKSEIMNWSIENRFSRGIFLLPELLGFDKDEDGNLVINDDEADTVRLCFYLFIAGFQLSEIAELLTEMGRKTGFNKQHNKKPGVEPEYNTNWTSNSVLDILRNGRHCGDVLARKTFTPNFKNHKSKKNRGERQQVKKYDNHEAIVSREVFEAANAHVIPLPFLFRWSEYPKSLLCPISP